MKERELQPGEGKVLRYVTERGDKKPVEPGECCNAIPWSDLPHTFIEARAMFERLRGWGFVKRVDKGYVATKKGHKRVQRANKQREWMKPPPRAVTNRSLRD